MKKRIIVTGGTGFLVICVDNFYTGNKRNILHLMNNPYFEVIRHDITFPFYIEVDEIYNLAFPASPIYYQFDPVQTDEKGFKQWI